LGANRKGTGKGWQKKQRFLQQRAKKKRNLKILSNLKGEIASCHIALIFHKGKQNRSLKHLAVAASSS